MITKLEAKDYGCLKDVKLELTPIHAFIGPNDSGKSTLLHAVREVVEFASGTFVRVNAAWAPFEPRLAEGGGIRAVTAAGWYRIDGRDGGPFYERWGRDDTEAASHADRSVDWLSGLHNQADGPGGAILAELSGARLFRPDPDALRKPSSLIPGTEGIDFHDDRGTGLPGVLQAIQGRGDDSFDAIRKGVHALFPTIKRIGVPAVTRERAHPSSRAHRWNPRQRRRDQRRPPLLPRVRRVAVS